VREPIDRMMPLTGQVGLRWNAPDRDWWVEGVLTMAAKQDKLSTRDAADTSRIPPGGTPGYAVFSLRSGYRFTRNFAVTAAIENLTDENYRIHGSGVNEPGINFAEDYDQDGVEEYTEYKFNDSRVPDPSQYPPGYPVPRNGVSTQLIRAIPHPDEVFWAIDAIDWIPRHRAPSEKTRYTGGLDEQGSSNLLFGDQHVEMMTEAEYILGRDKYGSAPNFWNWGHVY